MTVVPETGRRPAADEALWRRWIDHQDAGARNRLVLTYAPMVKFLAARKIRALPEHCEMDDLVSSGLLALMGAIDRFDPARGVSFETFAWIRISGAIVDELRRLDWAPRSLRQQERTVDTARRAFQARFGRAPTDEELSDALGIALDDLRRHVELEMRTRVVSLSSLVSGADDSPGVELGDSLQDDTWGCDPEQSALANEHIAALKTAVQSLSPREQRILGLAVVDGLRGGEIAEMFDLSPSRVSQMLTDIRRKLKTRMTGYDSDARAA
jgi:RNA polymerase sigma factor for flagellar operon FliA